MPKLVRVAWWWSSKAGTPEVEHDLLAVLREAPNGTSGGAEVGKKNRRGVYPNREESLTDISFGCQTIHTGNVVAPDVRGRPRQMPWFGGEINPVSAKEAVQPSRKRIS